jgi:hypothetical protein
MFVHVNGLGLKWPIAKKKIIKTFVFWDAPQLKKTN